MIFIFRHYLANTNSQLFQYACCFFKKKVPVIIFSSNYIHNEKKRLHKGFFLFHIEDVNGVKIAWVNNIIAYSSNGGFLRILNMFEFCILSFLSAVMIIIMYGRPTLIIGSVAHTPNLFSTLFLSRIVSARYWIEVSELWPEAFISSGLLNEFSVLARILKTLSGFAYRRAEFITTINPNSTRIIVEKYRVPLNNVVTFIPGFSSENQYFSDSTDKSCDCFDIVYGGSFGELYPLENLVEAIKILRDSGREITCHLIGGGIRESALKEKIKYFNLSNCVKISKFMSRDEYERNLHSADVLIVVERAVGFGFPSKLLDYFHFKRPILMCLEKFYENIKEPVVQVRNDSNEIASALDKLLSMSKSDRIEMGMNTFKYASNEFDVTKQFLNKVWTNY